MQVQDAVVRVNNLTVQYGTFTALSDFSVDFPSGSTGLLGPNGAGKTTLLKTLLGFVKPTRGTAEVLGHDIFEKGRAIRQLVGLMPEQECHLPGMSAVEYVTYTGELAGMPHNQALRRAHEVLEYCSLGEARYRNVETFSTGMRQRIKLAQALVHGPKLLFLDEPTNGLDPRGREEMLEMIRSISAARLVNVVVTSHVLKDIERTCEHAVVLAKGALRAQGKISELLSIEGQPVNIELREFSEPFINALTANGFQLVASQSTHVRVLPETSEALGQRLFRLALESGAEIRSFEIAQKSLEEAFLEAIA